MPKYDIIIVGAGIVGLATAYKLLLQKPNVKIAILEKENDVAQHQTGHNSGVIHSGIYYKPGSLKAINCKTGYDELLKFCNDFGIKHDICGKLIVATQPEHKQPFENIYQRGIENGLEGIRKISQAEAKEIEPHVACLEAIWVPQTGIVDYKAVSKVLVQQIQEKGGVVHFNQKVIKIATQQLATTIITDKSEFTTSILVNCAGLYSDKISKMTDSTLKNTKIVPFRGEYYELKKEKEYLVKNLIYPVPNPNFPFLGVHFTRMINGGIEAGPNAVLAFRREGYTRWDINFSELFETLAFPGFRKVASKYWDEGFMELKRSFSKKLFVKAMQELIPAIEYDDVERSGAGVRAQACDADGGLIDDFMILENANVINVVNAPSPAATSSLSIGQTISNKIIQRIS